MRSSMLRKHRIEWGWKLSILGPKQSPTLTCEPNALASGINTMPFNLATPDPKPDAMPDASAFGSLGGTPLEVLTRQAVASPPQATYDE